MQIDVAGAMIAAITLNPTTWNFMERKKKRSSCLLPRPTGII